MNGRGSIQSKVGVAVIGEEYLQHVQHTSHLCEYQHPITHNQCAYVTTTIISGLHTNPFCGVLRIPPFLKPRVSKTNVSARGHCIIHPLTCVIQSSVFSTIYPASEAYLPRNTRTCASIHVYVTYSTIGMHIRFIRARCFTCIQNSL